MTAPSSTFVLPPTDGSLALNRLVDFHLEHNPRHPWVVLSATDIQPEIIVTYEQLGHAVHRAAHIINPNASIPEGTKVGILAAADTVVYLALILGALRAGLIPFPISPRTQIAGITHLLTTANTPYAIIGGSPTIIELGNSVTTSLETPLNIIALPTFAELYPELVKVDASRFLLFPEVKPTGDDSTVIIIHSSGSTGLPRPVPFHQKGVLCNVVQQPAIWEAGEAGERVALMALPTFHAMGYILQCLGPLFTGYVPVLFAPSSPPAMPTAELIMETMVRSGCTFLFTVPAFLESWAKDDEAIKELKKLRGIMYAGGPLAQWIGDKLTGLGVPVYALYGSTEAGCVTFFNPSKRSPSDWVYVEFCDSVDARFVEQHDSEGTCELIFVESETHKPFVFHYEMDGKRAYETKDLLIRHPSKEGLWKIVGRLDDQIILLNGEKTNPGPMEAEIRKSPVVQFAAMFGRERNQTGVLIELTPAAQPRSVDSAGRTKLIEEIWPYVEKANATSPSHSRLDKSTIIFTHPDRPLPRTPKGTVPRAAAIKAYKEDIDSMYASIEKGGDEDVVGPVDWAEAGATKWLKERVEELMGRNVNVEGDLFQQGLDSLTATLLSRTLKSALHGATDPNIQSIGDKITQQTIFAKPSIQQLVQHITSLSSGSQYTDPAALRKAALGVIKTMIDRHTPNRPSKVPQLLRPATEHIVLTGTTGALGSHLLAQLLQNDKVERVWALNRKSRGGDGMKRQRASFEDKKLDVQLLESHKLVFLEAELTDVKLGLESDVLEQIRASATAIIHNAWQVNFNLSLQSFESNIMGAENLINLAFNSVYRPRVLFTSSISAAGIGEPGMSLPEEYIQLEDVATGFGYGESKFVTEKMLESAQSSGLETCVVRLGQLTGDKLSGSWSPSDWVPSFIASSLSVGCLPDAVGSISWIPLDIAATTIIDTCLFHEALLPPVIHCAHPRPIPWSEAMVMFAHVCEAKRGKSLAIVPFAEWNIAVASAASVVSSADESFKQYPSTKIQSTFEGMMQADEQVRRADALLVSERFEAGGMARMSTKKAEALSETLRVAEPLGRDHIEMWVAYWEKQGLFV